MLKKKDRSIFTQTKLIMATHLIFFSIKITYWNGKIIIIICCNYFFFEFVGTAKCNFESYNLLFDKGSEASDNDIICANGILVENFGEIKNWKIKIKLRSIFCCNRVYKKNFDRLAILINNYEMIIITTTTTI